MTGAGAAPVTAPDDGPGRTALIANVVLCQVGWFACVLGAARAMGHAGAALGAVIVVGHVLTAARPAREAALVGLTLLIGAAVDGFLLQAGLIVYADPGPLPAFPPAWLMVLWALFAVMLNRSLRWLRGRPLLGAVFGAVGGPLSYLGASRLGAVTLPSVSEATLALAVAWAVVMPLLFFLARRFDGVGAGAASAAPAPVDAMAPGLSSQQVRR